MKACVYTPRTARPEAFQRPVVGGEPIIRWIFLQVCCQHPCLCSRKAWLINDFQAMLRQLRASARVKIEHPCDFQPVRVGMSSCEKGACSLRLLLE